MSLITYTVYIYRSIVCPHITAYNLYTSVYVCVYVFCSPEVFVSTSVSVCVRSISPVVCVKQVRHHIIAVLAINQFSRVVLGKPAVYCLLSRVDSPAFLQDNDRSIL